MSVPTRVIKSAESVDGECPVTIATALRIRTYLERHGIEFLPAGREPVVRLLERSASDEAPRAAPCRSPDP